MLSLSQLRDFRLTCYRRMYFQDSDIDDSIQDLHRVWQESEDMVRQCLTALKHLPSPSSSVSLSSSASHPVGRVALSSAECIAFSAQLLLTALVALQVGIRNYEPLTTVIDSALLLLPKVTDSHLRTHLLVHLYGETEDESLYAQLQDALTIFHPETEEDQYLLQTIHKIEEEISFVS